MIFVDPPDRGFEHWQPPTALGWLFALCAWIVVFGIAVGIVMLAALLAEVWP